MGHRESKGSKRFSREQKLTPTIRKRKFRSKILQREERRDSRRDERDRVDKERLVIEQSSSKEAAELARSGVVLGKRSEKGASRKKSTLSSLGNLSVDDIFSQTDGDGFEALLRSSASAVEEDVDDHDSEDDEGFDIDLESTNVDIEGDLDLEGDDGDRENKGSEIVHSAQDVSLVDAKRFAKKKPSLRKLAELASDDGDREVDDLDESNDIMQHQKDLEHLRETDPEFFKYLQQNDEELLKFGIEENSVQPANIPSAPEVSKSRESRGEEKEKILTSDMISAWTKATSKGSLVAAKRLLLAFRCAVRFASPESIKDHDVHFPLRIVSSSVFHLAIISAMSSLPKIFDKIMGFGQSSSSSTTAYSLPTSKQHHSFKSKSWKRISPYVKSFLIHALTISQLISANDLSATFLHHLVSAIPYIAAFKSIIKGYLKLFLSKILVEDDAVRLRAFICLRNSAILLPRGTMDLCLKGLYLTYVRNSKFVSARTLPSLQFLCNCVAELFTLDLSSSYQHAFAYIRQLAITLRKAYSKNSQDIFSIVYNWQFINSLRLWTQVLCACPGEDQLGPLVYPLTQIILGVIDLSPSTRFFPLRFLCCRFLCDLEKHTRTFIPIARPLLEIFAASELHKPPKPDNDKLIDFFCTLRISKSAARSRRFQESMVAETLEILVSHLSNHAYSIAFPEFSAPVSFSLQQFSRSTKISRLQKQLKHFLDKIRDGCNFILSRRRDRGSSLSPKQLDLCSAFEGNLLGEATAEEERVRQAFLEGKGINQQSLRACSPVVVAALEISIKREKEREERIAALLEVDPGKLRNSSAPMSEEEGALESDSELNEDSIMESRLSSKTRVDHPVDESDDEHRIVPMKKQKKVSRGSRQTTSTSIRKKGASSSQSDVLISDYTFSDSDKE